MVRTILRVFAGTFLTSALVAFLLLAGFPQMPISPMAVGDVFYAFGQYSAAAGARTLAASLDFYVTSIPEMVQGTLPSSGAVLADALSSATTVVAAQVLDTTVALGAVFTDIGDDAIDASTARVATALDHTLQMGLATMDTVAFVMQSAALQTAAIARVLVP